MSPIEVIILLVAVVALGIALQARHDHKTVKQEAADDLATVKADVHKVVDEVKGKVTALENKGTPAAPAPDGTAKTAS